MLTITSSYSNEWEEVFKVTGVPKGIECPDTNNCYIVTDLNNLYGSSNKGKNWTFLTELTDKYNWVKDISVPDSSNIFVAHFESVIYQINNDISIVNDILTKEFLPHLGYSFKKKILYTGLMVNKLLSAYTQKVLKQRS